MACNRCFGSFCRQARSSRRTFQGARSHSGSLVNTSAKTCAIVSPVNRRCPVSISQRTTPKAQMSARRSTICPAACSGAIYPAVPRIIPACVAPMVSVGELFGSPLPAAAGCVTAARPKSRTLTTPAGVVMMLAGFRSRWMMPLSCAASSASAIWPAMRSASPSASGPLSVWPGTSSITSARPASVSSMP